jgi:putative ABC transport system ATP-binding protein
MPIDEQPAIACKGVSKRYRDGLSTIEVLKDVDFSARRGEVVAVEGPSGSGKTTLLSILGFILTPSEGEVLLEGNVVPLDRPDALPAVRRRAIGFVFQSFNLFESLSALENVEYALNIKGWRGERAHAEAEAVLKAVGLEDRLHFLPRDLSGGQKQRVAIARAVAGRPPVVLADEPTANLDSESSARILESFRELAKEYHSALVVVTHDTRIRSLMDRVVQIRDGKLSDTLENV